MYFAVLADLVEHAEIPLVNLTGMPTVVDLIGPFIREISPSWDSIRLFSGQDDVQKLPYSLVEKRIEQPCSTDFIVILTDGQ